MMPFINEGKMILQKTWCYRNDKDESLDWDDPLPAEIKDDFSKWIDKIPTASKLTYQRYIFNGKSPHRLSEELFLHIFCDAAEAAYGIAAYARYKTKTSFTSHLIYSASKVAPTKNKLSIPKKELNAIVLGCIKGEYLMNILKIPRENIILHTDSMV